MVVMSNKSRSSQRYVDIWWSVEGGESVRERERERESERERERDKAMERIRMKLHLLPLSLFSPLTVNLALVTATDATKLRRK